LLASNVEARPGSYRGSLREADPGAHDPPHHVDRGLERVAVGHVAGTDLLDGHAAEREQRRPGWIAEPVHVQDDDGGSSPSAPIHARTSPTSYSWPSAPSIRRSTPSASASTSCVTLSVSSS